MSEKQILAVSCQFVSSKPIHPHLKLDRIDSRIRRGQAGVGNVLVADACRERPALIVEELEAQRGVRKEVYVRRIQRHGMVAEKNSAAQFEIRDSAGRIGEVPL